MTIVDDSTYTKERYFMCTYCHRINEFFEQQKLEKDHHMLYTNQSAFNKFAGLAKAKGMNAHEALLYLMYLHEKNEEGRISNTVNVSIAK